MPAKPLISIVVPVYNEQEVLPETTKRLLSFSTKVKKLFRTEILFVNDGSTDETLAQLKQVAAAHRHIKIISFSRNFGHQIAITAGMDYARGDYVAIIDADLQDPPELIEDMYKMAQQGYDVVYGKRISRDGETWFKKITARWFYWFLRKMTQIDIPSDTGDFRLLSRKVVEHFKTMKEKHRFVRGMIPWLGFSSVAFEYHREPRFAGETKYPFRKMLNFALHAIFSFSSKPLALAIKLGLFTILGGMLGGIYMLYIKMFTNKAIPGITVVILALTIFHGVQILLIGIIGEYIARIFEEMKERPLYVVESTINF